jgi:hypothetical protein
VDYNDADIAENWRFARRIIAMKVFNHGKFIEVDVLDTGPTSKPRFEGEWVKFPRYWADQLNKSNYRGRGLEKLAIAILFEAFRQQKRNGQIVLSYAVTGLEPHTRHRAAKELVRLGLLAISQKGREAIRITRLYLSKERCREEINNNKERDLLGVNVTPLRRQRHSGKTSTSLHRPPQSFLPSEGTTALVDQFQDGVAGDVADLVAPDDDVGSSA